MRAAPGPVAAAAAGLAIAAGQAPLQAWWLAVPGWAALIWLLAGAGAPRRAAARAFVAGAGHFAAALSWIVEPFLVEPERHGWMAPFALILMAGGLALFWAAGAALGAWMGGASARARAAGIAGGIAAAELARGVVLTGFPWALPGHVWIGTPAVQAAAWIGASGLSVLTLVAAALPRALGPSPRGALAGAGLGALALALLWAAGIGRLAPPLPPPALAATVRIVQPNAAQHLKWEPEMAAVFFERLVTLSAGPAAAAPDLVLWPETAVPFVLPSAIAERALPVMAAAAGGAPLAFGVQRWDGAAWFNSLAVLDAAVGVIAIYDKHHLVPFGEYMPFGGLLARVGIRGFAVREGYGYAAGPGPAVLDLGPLGRVLPLICYEAIFPAYLRPPGPRPDWVMQVTNDGWFGEVSGPYQHLALARLRAVESGLPLVRAANTGVSAVIGPRGEILAALPLGVSAALDAPLPAALPPPPYVRLGDWPALGLILAALALAAAGRIGLDRAGARG